MKPVRARCHMLVELGKTAKPMFTKRAFLSVSQAQADEQMKPRSLEVVSRSTVAECCAWQCFDSGVVGASTKVARSTSKVFPKRISWLAGAGTCKVQIASQIQVCQTEKRAGMPGVEKPCSAGKI